MKLLDKKGLAELLGVSVRKLEVDLKKGLPHIKIGKLVRFEYDEVIKYYKGTLKIKEEL